MDYQTLIALGIVAVCGLYMLRRIVRMLSGSARGGCHGCSGGECPPSICPMNAESTESDTTEN